MTARKIQIRMRPEDKPVYVSFHDGRKMEIYPDGWIFLMSSDGIVVASIRSIWPTTPELIGKEDGEKE